MIFLSLLSRKVNQFAGFLGPHTTGHHRGPTQGSYQKPAGKVNQIPTNPRHFPLWSTHYRALQVPHTGELSGNRRESEPYSHESWALSPMAHALQAPYTGELPENHRESEPNSHESWALPLWPTHYPGYIPVQCTFRNSLRSCLKFFQKFFMTPFRHLSAIFIVK